MRLLFVAILCLLVFADYAQADDDRLNRTIEVLEQDDPVFGIFTADFSLTNARALATSGLDFIFIDMEHSPLDFQTLRVFLLGMTDKATIASTGSTQMATTPLVRIPTYGSVNPQAMVKQALDAGAYGIVFPFIETREQAQLAIQSMRYPAQQGDPQQEPIGLRGASPAIPAWLWGTRDYMAKADLYPLDPNGELLAVLQIESKAGVENIDEIASLPGVGAIFLGPSDLSLSYGLAGKPDDPTLVAAMQKVLDACAKYDVPCGRTSNAANVARHLEEGHSFLTIGYWSDAGISTGPGEGLKAAHEASGRSKD